MIFCKSEQYRKIFVKVPYFILYKEREKKRRELHTLHRRLRINDLCKTFRKRKTQTNERGKELYIAEKEQPKTFRDK